MAVMFGFVDIIEEVIKKMSLKSFLVLILSAVILLTTIQLSFADYASFTVNVPNTEGGYTSIVIRQSGEGYVGPQGEYYPQFPSVIQLQNVYGLTASNSTVVVEASLPQEEIVSIAPPALPVYIQPDPPAPNYIWTPGYWRYDSFFQDYYWVPGTWVTAPTPGYLWTPGYWYWRNEQYVYSEGYWDVHIGFYGGINYGHGYDGNGFSGGAWRNNVFVNRTVNVTNITNNTTINNSSSFNGGPGGINAKPTYEQQAVLKEKHIPPTAVQRLHAQSASNNTALRASLNHGKPAIAATVKPGVFKGDGVVAAKQAGAFYNKPKQIKIVEPRNNQRMEAVRPSGAMQQNKTLPYVSKTSNGTQVQQKSGPAEKYIQQRKNQPNALTKAQLSQKKNVALKAQQEKKKREQQLLQKQQEQQAQSSNPQNKVGNGS